MSIADGHHAGVCEVAVSGGVRVEETPDASRPARLALECGLDLDSGRRLERVDITFQTYGELNAEKSNAVLVCPCLTAGHHVAGVNAEGERGWWDWLIGPERPLDTGALFVICPSLLGSCTGTTGPLCADPCTGEPYGPEFPEVTIGDMTRAHARLLSCLGIEKLRAVIGGSIGGMQALEFGSRFPDRVESVIAIAAAARLSAQGVAINHIGRESILNDRGFAAGRYYEGRGPVAGLAAARQIAHLSYLSRPGMDSRFGEESESVRSYLGYQGDKFTRRFDANAYLRMIGAMDSFRWSGPRGYKARLALVSITSDWLFPVEDSAEIVNQCAGHGVRAQHHIVRSNAGHDGFLTEAGPVGRAVRLALGA